MKKMFLSEIFMFVLLCTILSCKGLQNVKQAEKYKSLDVHEFSKKRYKKDTVFLFNAAYNNVNLSDLRKPYNDFSNFCKVKGGNFKQVTDYNEDVFTTPTDLDRLTSKFLTELEEKGSQSKWAYDELLVANATQRMVDAYTDKPGAIAGFNRAKNIGLFGEFECDCKAQGGKNWKVSITPVKYLGGEMGPSGPINYLQLLLMIKE